ncbi:MAG: hypothetical protein QM731_02985 [Chitinophagaceae bacterium]
MNDPTNSRYRYLAFASSNSYRRYVQEDKRKEIHHATFTPNQNEIPAHGTYASALFRPEWKLKREQILQRDMHSCVICKKNDDLQVHHRQYHFVVQNNKFRLPWEYPDHLLITLCESCHRRGHNKFKVPTINI